MEVLQRTANRGSISDGGYEIANSLKNEPDNGERFDTGDKFTNYSSVRKFTVSGWFKRTELSVQSIIWYNVNTGTSINLQFESGDFLSILLQDNVGNGVESYAKTSALFRDTSAWYHIVWKVDTTQSTEADRFRVYVNGAEITDWASRQYPTQNFDTSVASGLLARIGSYDSTYHGSSGYMAEFNYLDGLAVAPTEFGEYDDDSGIWIPKEYTGSYPGQSAYLDFKDGSNLGANAKGDDTDWTENNITSADQATDTPTNNFCTWNILPLYNGTIFSFPNGATEVKRTSGTGWTTAYSSMGANKGKWYAEFQVLTSGNYLMNGNVPLAKIQSVSATQFYLGSEANAAAGAGYYSSGTTGNDYIYHDGGATESGVVTSAGDIISVAMDCDNNKIHFAVNGSYTNSSNPATNTNGFNMTDDYQFFAHATLTGSQTWKNNFGGYTGITISSAASDANGYGTFEYAPPSGYYALCTKNLAEYG